MSSGTRTWACGMLFLACWAPAAADGPPARNLVVVTLDTVRRDHLPTYGYARDTAPALAALAREGLVFDQAFAQETNTNPSHASMFTGLYPHTHGNRRNGDLLSPERRTLAELLRGAGFRTAAFVSGATLKREACGLDRGFEGYDDDFSSERRDALVTTRRALGWLGARRKDERYFLFVHLFDAHGPYSPAGEYRTLYRSEEPGPAIDVPPYQAVRDESGEVLRGINGYVDRYDAMIRYLDDQLQVLLGRIDLEDTAVMVLGDHGESLGERFHKLDHGAQVFDEEIRIPWIVRAPGASAGRVQALAETTDLLPTALELLGLAPPTAIEGRSLVGLLGPASAAAGSRVFVFSTARADSSRHSDRGYRLDRERPIESIRSARFKLVRYPGRSQDYLELYDLARDPGERENVSARFPAVRAALLRRLDAWSGREAPPSSAAP